MRSVKFAYDHPLTELICELEVEASSFCEKCHQCFDDVSYNLEQIKMCKKLPELYRLYWQAKSACIAGIAPLSIFEEGKRKYKNGPKKKRKTKV